MISLMSFKWSLVISVGVGRAGWTEVPDHQALVSHQCNKLLSALVRLKLLPRGDGKLTGKGWRSSPLCWGSR